MDMLDNSRSTGKDAAVRMADGVLYCGPVWMAKGTTPEPSRFFVLYQNQRVGVYWSIRQGKWTLRPSHLEYLRCQSQATSSSQ